MEDRDGMPDVIDALPDPNAIVLAILECGKPQRDPESAGFQKS